jgi:ribonuclease BN (tRNA processing enzyme)
VKLTIVGCSGSMPGPTSPASCYLVQAGDTSVLLDLGNGALGPLQRHVELDQIDAVLLSHLHADHCMDLCGYYVGLRYGPWRDRDRVPVYGPAGTAERMARAYGVDDDRGMTDEFDFRPYPDGSFEIGDLTVTARRVPHFGESDPQPMEAFAVRLDHAGTSLVYSGDTSPSTELVDLAAGADLLLCEAAFEDGAPHPPNLHLTGEEAGQCAADAGVRMLMLTHIPPWGDADRARSHAAEVYSGPVGIAKPGAIVTIDPSPDPSS